MRSKRVEDMRSGEFASLYTSLMNDWTVFYTDVLEHLCQRQMPGGSVREALVPALRDCISRKI